MEVDPHIEPELQEPAAEAEAEDAAPAAEEPRRAPVVLDHAQQLRLLEAMLFAAAEPLSLDQIAARMPKETDINGLLNNIEELYADRGVNVVRVAGKVTMRTAPDLVDAMKVERTVRRKLSRAAIETLAIIGYHQPVTRAEIEEIRGVALSKGTLELLMEAGWIQPRGHRETPGRPALWVTTEDFLLHFGLDKLDDLPGVEDLRAAGLLDARPAVSAYSEEAGLTFADPPGESEDESENEDVGEEAEIDRPSPDDAAKP